MSLMHNPNGAQSTDEAKVGTKYPLPQSYTASGLDTDWNKTLFHFGNCHRSCFISDFLFKFFSAWHVWNKNSKI